MIGRNRTLAGSSGDDWRLELLGDSDGRLSGVERTTAEDDHGRRRRIRASFRLFDQ